MPLALTNPSMVASRTPRLISRGSLGAMWTDRLNDAIAFMVALAVRIAGALAGPVVRLRCNPDSVPAGVSQLPHAPTRPQDNEREAACPPPPDSASNRGVLWGWSYSGSMDRAKTSESHAVRGGVALWPTEPAPLWKDQICPEVRANRASEEQNTSTTDQCPSSAAIAQGVERLR